MQTVFPLGPESPRRSPRSGFHLGNPTDGVRVPFCAGARKWMSICTVRALPGKPGPYGQQTGHIRQEQRTLPGQFLGIDVKGLMSKRAGHPVAASTIPFQVPEKGELSSTFLKAPGR